jgi:hypothetical protein
MQTHPPVAAAARQAGEPARHACDGRAARLELETAAVLALVRRLRPGSVNVGHGRDPASIVRAEAFAGAWTDLGGDIGVVVSWPATAASWLRQARRLAAGADTWVVADTPSGWAGIGPRLAATGLWRADRTVAFPGLDDPALSRVAGPAATEGLRGVSADGCTWQHTNGWLRTGRPLSAGS